MHAAKSRHTGLAKLKRHAHAGLWRRGALSNLREEPPRVFRQAAKQHVTCAQAHHCAHHNLGTEQCRSARIERVAIPPRRHPHQTVMQAIPGAGAPLHHPTQNHKPAYAHPACLA